MAVPSDKELHRAAARLVSALTAKALLRPKEKPADLEKRVFEALQRNFREEAAIDREAERLVAEHGRKTPGVDQRKLFLKIRDKIAKDRGFVL